MNLLLFADGGSRKNPGPAACGYAIIEHSKISIKKSTPQIEERLEDLENLIFEGGLYLNHATNNVAEWEGLRQGLKWVLANYDPTQISLQVLMDSNLVVQQIQGNWKVKEPNLKQFYNDCKEMVNQFNQIQFDHIYREFNKRADLQVNLILDNQKSSS